MHHAIIMAGGSGTRLWPLSRQGRPKQLLRLFGGQSLLRLAFDRLRSFLTPEQIYLVAGRADMPALAAELPELPAPNRIAEPCPRDTANAIGLAAHVLAGRDPQGTMGVFTADHVIAPVERFRDVVRRAYQAAERYPDELVTFGVRPSSPHTGYGYIHAGRQIAPEVREVVEFKEKPDLATAEGYVASGEYFWNSGMFVWQIPTIISELARLHPDAARKLAQVAAELDDPSRSEETLATFQQLPRISIDFAVMERARRVLVIELGCEWLDVGSWNSLAELLPPDAAGNTCAAPQVRLLDASGNILVSESDHLIATIGVQDLIVVHGQDATLICRRDQAQRIKELVEHLPPAQR